MNSQKKRLNILWPSSIRFVREPPFIFCLSVCEAAGCILKSNLKFRNNYETLLFKNIDVSCNLIIRNFKFISQCFCVFSVIFSIIERLFSATWTSWSFNLVLILHYNFYKIKSFQQVSFDMREEGRQTDRHGAWDKKVLYFCLCVIIVVVLWKQHNEVWISVPFHFVLCPVFVVAVAATAMRKYSDSELFFNCMSKL